MTISHIPPHSEEAERGLLGAMLQDCNTVLPVAMDAGVNASSFYVPALQVIYNAIIALNGAGRAVDMITVSDKLKQSGSLEQAGGEVFIDNLCDSCVTTAHSRHYADILVGHALTRSVIQSAREVENDAMSGNATGEELRSKAEYAFAKLVDDSTDTPDASRALGEAAEMWERARSTGCAGIRTGIPLFDETFGGLLPSSITFISGEPGTGKTTLARNIGENIGERGLKVGYFTLEQTEAQMWGAIAARYAGQSVFKLNCGFRGEGADIQKVIKAMDTVKQWPITMIDAPQTPTSLWSSARRGVSKFGWDLLIIDYLQKIRDDMRHDSLSGKVSYFSDTVYAIAKALKLPVIALSSLSRGDQMYGSGQLDFDGWNHVSLKKAEDFRSSHIVEASIKKNRYGPSSGQRLLKLRDTGFLESADTVTAGYDDGDPFECEVDLDIQGDMQ